MRAPQRLLGGCLALLGTTATSCSYLADRALDFTDAFRFTLGAGTAAGVRARAGLALDTGLLIGVKPRAGTLGWRYGAFYFFDQSDSRIDCEQAEIVRSTALLGHDFTDGSYQTARTSLCLLPALFSWVDSTPTDYEWHVPPEGTEFSDRHWLWSGEGFRNNRYQQIHAFDVEAEVALFLHTSSGFSPGEALDFLLGFFLIDIAADDGRLDQ
ncbi:MAG TPA: hypothetical protein VFT55_15520 [Planctomycetota bacterium]|nr:hypothetical protein [Planctomycetota bacterium]